MPKKDLTPLLYIAMFIFLDAQPQHANKEPKKNLEKFHTEKINYISNLKSAYLALVEFCGENNLNYNHVIQWLKISPELASQYDEHLKLAIEPNKKFTDHVKQKLLSIWEKHVSKKIL